MSISTERRGHDLRQILAAEGVETFDALVERLEQATNVGADAREDELDGTEDPAKPSVALPPNPHQPPQMALTIDGASYEPSVITELNGRALHSTPGVDRHGEAVLHAFTDLRSLQDHLKAHAFDDIGTTNPDSLSDISRYFEHASQGGDELRNNPGRAWSDLTAVRRGFLGLSNWNDLISAVDWCRWDISLYEHVGYGGSQLYLRAGRTYNNVSDFGWNDRASATVNWGRRF